MSVVKKIRIECSDEEFNKAADAAQEIIKTKDSNQERAAYVRRIMDDKFGPAWSCVCGHDFGSEVPYLSNHFAFFTVKDISFLICKTSENVQISN